MIPAYLRDHYVRRAFNRLHKPNSVFRGFLGWTGLLELEKSGNIVEYLDGRWVINPTIGPFPEAETDSNDPEVRSGTDPDAEDDFLNISVADAKERWLALLGGC